MPTVFSKDGFRFFFFSDEHDPTHVHVTYGESEAQIVIDTLEVTFSTMKKNDLKKALDLANGHKTQILEAWNEHFRKHNR